ncbi:glycosyltransferase, group 2 family protein [[Clostridium] hylemonae DSM 15053]|uniref:Glycosyltransferase, group 2 family protein n=2 Tax=[Clostridium] hylemonae TaxID=89153 RepID=C0C2D4_9FIRM|nr:glycosyltransferase, group 2 family protein [[Clostridium] hylemonae DSM 15053]
MNNSPTPFITFIIPAYNAEKVIESCIESIIAIKRSDLEIVIVNDGSQDGTLEICGKIDDERIRIFTQENKGVSAARNRGILEARGRFVAFVDSDDLLCPQEMEKVLNSVSDKDELIMFNFSRNRNGVISKDAVQLEPGVHGKKELLILKERVLDVPIYKNWKNHVMQGSAVQYLYKRTKLIDSDIFFEPKLVYSEDLCFCLEIYTNFDSIKVTSYYAYIINAVNNSSSRRYREEFWNELLNVYEKINTITQSEYESIYYYYGRGAINHYLQYLPVQEVIDKSKKIIYDEKFKTSIKNISFANKTWSEKLEDWFYIKNHYALVIYYKKIDMVLHRIGAGIKRKIRFIILNGKI